MWTPQAKNDQKEGVRCKMSLLSEKKFSAEKFSVQENRATQNASSSESFSKNNYLKFKKNNNDEWSPQITDPRPDMEEDSKLWLSVLTEAWEKNQDLFYLLHGFRCMGTRIMKTQTSYRLRPEIDGRGWQNTAHYESVRDMELVKFQKEVAEIFREL